MDSDDGSVDCLDRTERKLNGCYHWCHVDFPIDEWNHNHGIFISRPGSAATKEVPDPLRNAGRDQSGSLDALLYHQSAGDTNL